MKRFASGDIATACVDTGAPRPAAPTLLLVHGFPLSHAMWRAQIDGLRDACRVLAPDLRGYGETPLGAWPTDAGASLARYADDLAAMLEAARPEGPVVYCGFSMGGYIAWSFLERYRDRLAGLVLMDTRAANDDDAARAVRLKMADHVEAWGAGRVAELMRPKLFGPAASPEVVEATCATIAAADPRSIAASQRAMAARPDATGGLGAITLPTLVVVGEDDAISPRAEMRGVADAIPGARFEAIARAGHMAPVEQPEAVNAALRSFVAAV